MKKLLILATSILFCMNTQAQLKTVVYHDGTQKLNGLVTSNTGKKHPAVLVLPAWMGIDDEAKQAALDLEKQGYVAFVADIYGEGNIPKDNAAAGKLASQYKNDYNAYQRRIALALETLKQQGVNTEKIAVIGYCFGGTGALEAARANLPVVSVVSIHGGLGKAGDRTNLAIHPKILVENPAEDKGVSQTDYNNLIKEMNEGSADWQIVTYSHCGHTFTNPASPEYNPIMAKRAWQHTLMFLKETLSN